MAARSKIAAELEALRFKTDVPARVGDSLANLAIAVTERVMDHVTSADAEPTAADGEPMFAEDDLGR